MLCALRCVSYEGYQASIDILTTSERSLIVDIKDIKNKKICLKKSPMLLKVILSKSKKIFRYHPIQSKLKNHIARHIHIPHNKKKLKAKPN